MTKNRKQICNEILSYESLHQLLQVAAVVGRDRRELATAGTVPWVHLLLLRSA